MWRLFHLKESCCDDWSERSRLTPPNCCYRSQRRGRAGYWGRMANYLSKMLPRIPFAPDFHAFAEAGKILAELHLGYETCEQYPLSLVFSHNGEPQPHHFRLTEKAMRFADDEKTTLRINEHMSLSGIPAEAHRYVVNGRTPLEWYIDRYKIKRDKESGIVNDPNGWLQIRGTWSR